MTSEPPFAKHLADAPPQPGEWLAVDNAPPEDEPYVIVRRSEMNRVADHFEKLLLGWSKLNMDTPDDQRVLDKAVEVTRQSIGEMRGNAERAVRPGNVSAHARLLARVAERLGLPVDSAVAENVEQWLDEGDPTTESPTMIASFGHWNHRVVKRTVLGEVVYGIHEVYYEPDGRTGWTRDPVSLEAEDYEGLRRDLRWMLAALGAEVIDADAKDESDEP